MNNGWVKLHRQILENDVFRHDRTAWHVFEVLLILANTKTGQWSGGTFQLAELCGINKPTLYKAILRLEKASMINRVVNARYTVYNIVKWGQYQADGKRSVNTEETLGNTLTRSKNKEVRNNIYVETQKVYDLFIQRFDRNPNLYKLTTARKAKIKSRLKDTGYDLIEQAINNTSKQSFYTGDNDRGWKADLDFILRSYEQVERLATQQTKIRKGIDILS